MAKDENVSNQKKDETNNQVILFLQLFEFDQSEFFVDLPEVVSMDSTGFIYVPTACQNKTKGTIVSALTLSFFKCAMVSSVCRLHIAFHGCLQGR